jgi:hypothetical protein
MLSQKTGYSPAMNLNFKGHYVIPKKFKERWARRVSLFNDSSKSFPFFSNYETYFMHNSNANKEIDIVAKECYRKYGVFPISFSYPDFKLVNHGTMPRRELFSTIRPGEAYTFSSANEYLADYAQSSMALTHKKVGWDCFRHVEIMSVGTIPIMPDVRYLPKFTMVHYPKKFLVHSLHQVQSGARPSFQDHEFIMNWARENLTSKAMARYIMRITKIIPRRILFIDEDLPKVPDYLSCMTLIGLEQLSDSEVTVAYPVDYLYDDYKGDTNELYGKGFGYTRILKRNELQIFNTERFKQNTLEDGSVFANFDLILIGNVSRNLEIANLLSLAKIQGNKIFIWGDDRPRSRRELKQIRSMDGHKFVREVY